MNRFERFTDWRISFTPGTVKLSIVPLEPVDSGF